MTSMDSTTSAPGRQPIPVNRFALFSETLLAGLLVLVLSLPLVTIPAAYAAGTAHLERHLQGRDDSVRGFWSLFKAALPGSWKLGFTTAAAAIVIVLNLVLAWAGQLPGRGLVLPAPWSLPPAPPSSCCAPRRHGPTPRPKVPAPPARTPVPGIPGGLPARPARTSSSGTGPGRCCSPPRCSARSCSSGCSLRSSWWFPEPCSWPRRQ